MSLAVYDPRTQWLLTGDTVYPGRLYVEDFPAFLFSLNRLVSFAQAHPVSAVMGCHIEMSTTAGVDYPVRATCQPHEAPLPMTPSQLDSILQWADSVQDKSGIHHFDDVVIVNGRSVGVQAWLLGRGLWWKIRQGRGSF